ncbi:MAG: DUF502 domain-containing protein [Bacteroidetes bacterium]|nr:DUF502 domain-containing protein [Bacteroidota bacterium]MBU1114331.1 DUF502 domain-containing protein [Bacteroidota bacterium]MBU1797109.1 DUF502 domain-containing protein [Bacteroidota bacterium]
MIKIKYFLQTTLFGGLLVIMPLIVSLLLIKWVFNFLLDAIEPITFIIIRTAKLNYLFSASISVVILLAISFAIGLFVKTKLGIFSHKYFEDNFLKRIPFYKIIKETIIQLFGTKKSLFRGVALVDLFGSGNLVTAFITDIHENGMYTVFVPSGPAPTAGFVYHIKAEYLTKIDYPLDQSMRTIISLGVGSNAILKKYSELKKTNI